MTAVPQNKDDQTFYNLQNKRIHAARNQLGMDLDDCRELARQISGKASISSLSLRERWELIEELKAKGARINNPPLPKPSVPPKDRPQLPPFSKMVPSHNNGTCPLEIQQNREDVYPARLAFWNKKFPNRRPGFASNQQLAWIQTLWDLDFNDGRSGSGLRGFIFRQTRTLKQGPISDLSFLRSHQVEAVMIPLKAKSKKD